ncbi:MAG: thioredoxin domain-containing protein [Flavipsychrobacter sp.]
MKKVIYLLPLVALLFVFAANPKVKEKQKADGIEFFHGKWNDAVTTATKEDKLMFIDVYTTWCGPCKALKARTFPDKELGNYFNEHFTSVAMDAERGEGVLFAQKYNVGAYPTMIILDSKGRVISTILGYKTPEQLLQFGKAAVAKYNKEYKKG